jgi:hypothetical protein
MLKFIFRIAFIVLGLFLVYVFGGAAAKTVWYQVAGSYSEGRVIGFVAGRGRSIQEEGTGVRKGKTRARRPAFRFAVAGQPDSVTVISGTSVLFTFSQYALHERVPVVYSKSRPDDAYIFGIQILLMQLLCLLLALFMIKMGVTGRA